MSDSPVRALRRRVGAFAARQIARLLDALAIPIDLYRLAGVPLRSVEVPGQPVPPPATQPQADETSVSPPLALFIVSDGLADAKGLVLDRRSRLVNPAALGLERYLANWQHQVSRVRPATFSGSMATLAHAHDGNLFHWLFEQLPKLALLDAAGVKPDRLYLAQRHRFQRESLSLFGIPVDRTVATDDYPAVRAERLLAITHWDAFRSIPAWGCDFLRARARIPDAPLPTAERIYISRADANGRRVVNENEVLTRLARFGFRRVVLSEHSIAMQAAMFRNANVVVGPHGAGLANAVFCRPGARLVELAAPRYRFGCWRDLAAKCDLDFSLLPAVGTDLAADHGWRYQREDFVVDVDSLETLIKDALG